VSVIIPCYNGAATIRRALDSLRAQTCRAIEEIIVVDDASTDDLDTALPTGWPELRVVRHLENRGLAASRNTGVEAATRSIVAFLDADDEWLPSKLQEQLHCLPALPERSVLFAWPTHAVSGEGGRSLTRWRVRARAVRVSLRSVFRARVTRLTPSALVRGGATFTGASLITRRELFGESGGYDQAIRVCEDYDFFLRLMAQDVALFALNRPLYRVYIRPDSLHRSAPASGTGHLLKVLGRFDPRHSVTGRRLLTEAEFDDAYQSRLLGAAVTHLQHGLREEGIALLRQAQARGEHDGVRSWVLRMGLRHPDTLEPLVVWLLRLGILRR
jgi:glycosyltransferase involved in cell wall biosynthesis